MIADAENILRVVRERYDGLSPSEQAVADRVLADPDGVPSMALAVLAREIGVSEPTVIRFCRSVDCGGFQEFKVRLAGSLATHFPFAGVPVTPESSVSDYVTKVFDASLDTLLQLRASLDRPQVEHAIDVLVDARRIEFYGVGASGVVALDAQHKFFRLSTPTTAHRDSHMQLMAAAALGPGDVVLAISHTGRTRSLIEAARVARASGARTIGLTAGGTPLAAACDLVVAVDVPEDTDHYTPMVSRLAHLVVIDVLALGVALRGGEANAERLRRIKEALRGERVSPDGITDARHAPERDGPSS